MSEREIELTATFESVQTARKAAKLLNAWFAWIMGDNQEDPEDIQIIFDDFDLVLDDYVLEKDIDVDWIDMPEARAQGNMITVGLDSNNGIDTIQEMLESMGAQDFSVGGED